MEETQENRTTYFVYGYAGKVLLEESSGETAYISHVYAFGKIFAKVDGLINTTTLATAEISYFHHDNLGSSRLMTDAEGKVIMNQDYLPFGGDLPGVGQTEVIDEESGGYKYTGQKEVVSIGLYYYGARYYDPEIARFITEDTYPGLMGNPQSQNIYVYVMNNPLKYVDPSGNIPITGIEFLPGLEGALGFSNSKYKSAAEDLSSMLYKQYLKAKEKEKELIAKIVASNIVNTVKLLSFIIPDDITDNKGIEGIPLTKENLEPEILEPPIVPGINNLINPFPLNDGIGSDVVPDFVPLPELMTPRILDFPLAERSIDDNIMMAEGNKYDVGVYRTIRGVKGLDAHHVGQKSIMKQYISNYDPLTAPAILVPKIGHTIRGTHGIVSRNQKSITNPRDLLARDIWELRRVYSDIPNTQLRELIEMNKKLYPELRRGFNE